jgi:NAD(P)-dependent dehydrogenase (short-subunit alcohol dehydrogenase family)
VLACRNQGRGEDAVRKIMACKPSDDKPVGKVEVGCPKRPFRVEPFRSVCDIYCAYARRLLCACDLAFLFSVRLCLVCAMNFDLLHQVMIIDTSEPESVKEFAKNAKAKLSHIDILVNNAGVMVGGSPHYHLRR